MRLKRKRLWIVLVMTALLSVDPPQPACAARGADPDRPLEMEDLEVRGFREKPERLYLPAPVPAFSRPPVPLNLFEEDMTRPMLPAEIIEKRLPFGGSHD